MNRSPEHVGPGRMALLVFGAVSFLTAAVFYEACFGLFILYDDPVIVTENPALRGDLETAIRWALWGDVAANWVPISALTHVIDVVLFGLEPLFHHLTSVVFHALAAGTLAVLLLGITESAVAAMLGAMLWAVHPMRVESVAWVAERRDVVSGLLLMLVLVMWERWARHGRKRDYRWSLAFAFCGLLSKATLVTVPVLLLIVDVWPLKRHQHLPWRSLLHEKLPFFVMSCFTSTTTLLVQQYRNAVTSTEIFGLEERLANSVVSLGRYAAKTLWPTDLIIPYALPADGWPTATVLGTLAVLAAALLLSLLAAQQGRLGALAMLMWSCVALAPVIGIIHVGSAAMANRYTYIPHVLPALAVATAATSISHAALRHAAYATLALACLMLGMTSWREVSVWHDSKRLFSRTVEVEPTNSTAWYLLAMEALYSGNPVDALAHARESVRHVPSSAPQFLLLAKLLADSGDHEGAVEACVELLTQAPTNVDGHARLAISLFALGQTQSALREAAQARAGVWLHPELRDELARAEMRASHR